MNVAGVDISTHAIDIVKLPFDGDQATWDRYELQGSTGIQRGLRASHYIPHGTYWDDVALVAIERPYGPGGDTLIALHLVVGAVAASTPSSTVLWLLHPAEWRKACGLPGNASKDDVWNFAIPTPTTGDRFLWSQDACDAYCIATAARNINQRGSLETTALEA